MSGRPGEGIDRSSLRGFEFRCRPNCGLCCYTTPRVTVAERSRLLTIRPDLSALSDGEGHLPSYPDGGACRMLLDCRCQVHEARPAPCAEFPITLHLGERAQCTLVLSCPGVDLEGLTRRRAPGALDGRGFDTELAAAERALDSVPPARRAQTARRWATKVRQSGLERAWVPADEVDDLDLPTPEELQHDALPDRAEGLESLPLHFEEGTGPVAFASAGEFLEAFALRERGGIEGSVTQLLRLEEPPSLSDRAERRLREYLGHMASRDAFVGAALAVWRPNFPGTIAELLRADLREISASVVARSSYRARLLGADGRRLESEDIDRGIRATDADYLDRPTLGEWV